VRSIEAKPWSEFLDQYADAIQSLNFITGMLGESYVAVLVLAFLGIWLSLKKSTTGIAKIWLMYALVFCATTTIALLVQRNHPPERVWIYGSLVFNLTLAAIFYNFVVCWQKARPWQHWIWIGAACLKLLVSGYVFPRYWNLNSMANERMVNGWWLEQAKWLNDLHPNSVFIEEDAHKFAVYLHFLGSSSNIRLGHAPHEEAYLIVPGNKLSIVPIHYEQIKADFTSPRDFGKGVYFFKKTN
jgi:hypothetical protein